MIVRVKSRGKNTTRRSRGRDRSKRRRRQRPLQIMPYGKHRGQRIADVPRDYLEWMVRENHRLADVAQAELLRRARANREATYRGRRAEGSD